MTALSADFILMEVMEDFFSPFFWGFESAEQKQVISLVN